MTIRMGWLLDFIDKPANGLNFNFWSGSGDLTFNIDGEDIIYKGTNGVIDIKPPNETANEAVRLIAQMDASDPNIRAQLHRDLGPLKIRLIWIYETSSDTAGSNDGITELTNILFTSAGTAIISAAPNNLTEDQVATIRFRNVGDETNFQVNTTYYAVINVSRFASNGWALLKVFSSQSQATANLTSNLLSTLPGQIAFTAGLNNTIFGIYNESEVVVPGVKSWVLSGKRFTGRLSAPTLSNGIYTIEVESLISDLDRGRTEIWSHDAHIRKYPDDKALEYMREYKDGIDTKWPP